MGEQRRVLLQDIADAVGVSVGSVSYALNGRPGVSEELRARIVTTARELGYSADLHARSLRTGRSGVMGLLIRDFRNPYFLDVIAGAQERGTDGNVTILAIDSDYSADREREHIRRLAQQRADGLAISPAGDASSIRLWQELRPGTPLVVLNATVQHTRGLVHVSADRQRAVQLSVDHLRGLGHRSIGFFELSSSVLADHERTELFLDYSEGLDVRPYVVETEITLDSVYRETRRALEREDRPTALIANSDFSAQGVYQAARDLGLTIGRDLSVVGQDDLSTSPFLEPPLTTLRLDRRNIGRALVERLLRPGELGDHHEPVELVVRRSTGPPVSP